MNKYPEDRSNGLKSKNAMKIRSRWFVQKLPDMKMIYIHEGCNFNQTPSEISQEE